MPQTTEIKIYDTPEAIKEDYDNFRSHWKYDRDQESGVHDSGLGLSKVFLGDSLKIKYHGYPEWLKDMQNSGLSEEDIGNYLRMIKNQFVTISENEPYVEPEQSIEEMRKEMEEDDAWIIEMSRKHHHYSEERLAQMAKELADYREVVLKRWEERGKRSDR